MKMPPVLRCASLLGLMLLLSAPARLSAQNPTPTTPPAGGSVTDTDSKNAFWDCTLPGGSYTVLLSRVNVVSLHEFNLTGGRVTEMNVVTEGSALARFYFMESLPVGTASGAAEAAKARLTELADSAADRTGTDKVWRKVVKDYPLATHAHTIEFRLQNKADLLALHQSLRTAWMRGQGRTVRVAGE
ncbi:MAG: hypothetical protein JWM59_905 [Verrucomicrobiales bacterium]|nr:hypothetical protein [Verrucomicrobiales bacterium]